jgi:peptide/nickel transport system permease protein
MIAVGVILFIAFIGLYAPFLASSKPIVVRYHDTWYFPLFSYLFHTGFYTKPLDIFFNIMMFTLPIALLLRRRTVAVAIAVIHLIIFTVIITGKTKDPASDPALNQLKQQTIQSLSTHEEKLHADTWEFQLDHINDYGKLNLVIRALLHKEQDETFQQYQQAYTEGTKKEGVAIPTLYRVQRNNEIKEIARLDEAIDNAKKKKGEDSLQLQRLQQKRQAVADKREWLETEQQALSFRVMPLIRSFHWEDDAGGEQDINQYVDWWNLTRINRKDLVASLLFGVRISLFVGAVSIALALAIGIPIGALAGYFGGKVDIIVSRLIEIWESMPAFFMLLMVVAIMQSKSIFLVIAVIGLFGWTGFSRFVRGEFFKQRSLPYVEACHAMGFSNAYIIFRHVLPNAIPPLLTLLPFSIMGAITSEAGLSYLGLGEEGSCSWGVLMDEGRSAFPGESYLLWPPALLLTILLVSIALIGDALRDALDPKLRS